MAYMSGELALRGPRSLIHFLNVIWITVGRWIIGPCWRLNEENPPHPPSLSLSPHDGVKEKLTIKQRDWENMEGESEGRREGQEVAFLISNGKFKSHQGCASQEQDF